MSTMSSTVSTIHSPRSWLAVTVCATALAACAAAIGTVAPTATARADACVSAGRHVRVSGCANVGQALAPYAPPPGYYAPLPEDSTPNVHGCIGYNGRWVNAGNCN